MIKMLSRTAALFASTATVIFAVAMPVFSQAPTDAQRNAIRSECRSDFEAYCASIPPGGAASLQCLQKNISSLSSSCQTAVRAVEAPAAPKAESAPAAPKAASTPAAAPVPALALRPLRPREELFVLRSACGGDVRALCGGVQPGAGRVVQCLATQAASLSPACKEVLSQFAAR